MVKGTGLTGAGLRLLDTATEDGSLESLMILGLGFGDRLGHSFFGEEPWATVIWNRGSCMAPSAKKGVPTFRCT